MSYYTALKETIHIVNRLAIALEDFSKANPQLQRMDVFTEELIRIQDRLDPASCDKRHGRQNWR